MTVRDTCDNSAHGHKVVDGGPVDRITPPQRGVGYSLSSIWPSVAYATRCQPRAVPHVQPKGRGAPDGAVFQAGMYQSRSYVLSRFV